MVVVVKGESDRSEGCERKMKVSNYKEEEKGKEKKRKEERRRREKVFSRKGLNLNC